MRGMLPLHIGALVNGGDPRLAPDGRRVVYTRVAVDLDGNRYRRSVWSCPIDDHGVPGVPHELVAGDRDASLARVSPDGTRLAYVTTSLDDDATGSDLCVRPVDGGDEDETIVTHTREGISELEWSPDSTRLAFVARDPDERTYGPDGEKRKAKDTPARRITTFFTRLDNIGWVADRPSRVWVVDARSAAAPRRVSTGPHEADSVCWSPDSARVAFTSARHDTWDLDHAVDLWITPADAGGDGELQCVTTTFGAYQRPTFTPDGSALVALVDPDPSNEPHHGRLVRVDVVPGPPADPVELAASLDRNKSPYPGVRAPVPLPSGAVVFAYEDSGTTRLARTTTAGGHEDIVSLAAWVTGFDIAGNVLACAISDDVTTVEIHVGKLGGPLHRATDHTRVLRDAGAAPAPMQRFVATSADGTQVECFALRPEGDGPFPTLLNIHGGPFTQYGHHLFDEFQMQLGAGFGVILCNPRGSSGYSEAWGRAIRWPEAKVDPGSGWGGVDHDDVMACANAAIQQLDWVDGDRLGVLGGSYGGYMTSWIVGHTDRFAAACSERSVNNLVTEEHNSDVASAFATTIGLSHLEAPEAYARQSPITYVREMRTPLLIIHSEDDLRCPINQAEELFVALRLLGRTPEFWRFPGESHELSRGGAPQHRVQRAEIILDFFGRHLGG